MKYAKLNDKRVLVYFKPIRLNDFFYKQDDRLIDKLYKSDDIQIGELKIVNGLYELYIDNRDIIDFDFNKFVWNVMPYRFDDNKVDKIVELVN